MIQLWINNSPYQSAFSLEDSAHLIIINTLPKKKEQYKNQTGSLSKSYKAYSSYDPKVSSKSLIQKFCSRDHSPDKPTQQF